MTEYQAFTHVHDVRMREREHFKSLLTPTSLPLVTHLFAARIDGTKKLYFLPSLLLAADRGASVA